MAVKTPCYCSREEVKRALDLKESAARNPQIDRAMEAAARDIEGRLRRQFYPLDTTNYFDWPNFQYAVPWRIWFDNKELAATPTAVVSGTTAIPVANIFFEPINTGPPFTYMEINRSSTSAFGLGQTPQRSVAITGTFGFSTLADSAGTLAASISSTSATTMTVSDSSLIGVGNVAVIDTERMIVSDVAMTTTSQTQQGAGCSTAINSDNALTVTDGTQYHVGEVVQLDTEWMLITSITGNVLTVKRAWDGTVMSTHSGATIYAPRLLTVTRGDLGTTAATHNNGTAVSIYRVPSLVKELAIALSINSVSQETSAYARVIGEGPDARPAPGYALSDLWQEAIAAYGRKNRKRVV